MAWCPKIYRAIASSMILAALNAASLTVEVAKASDSCQDRDVDQMELRTIRDIAHVCEAEGRDEKRTMGGDGFVCLGSYIHLKTADQYLKMVGSAKYIYVHNNSGGVSISGARIGDDIIDHKRVLVIHGYCTSACADYLFPAAERVIFIGAASSGSYLGWHGSPASHGLLANVDPEKHQMALTAHSAFLQRFSAERRENLSRLMDVPRDGLSAVEERRLGKIWTYTDDELCHEFHFDNITRISFDKIFPSNEEDKR